MKNLLFFLVLSMAIVSSCKTKKEVTKTAVDNNIAAEIAEQCFDSENDIQWSQVSANKFLTTNDEAGSNPVFFRADNQLLQRAFELSFKKHAPFKITLPFLLNDHIQCKTFFVRDSETMARQEQISMQIYTFKGEETERPENTIRLDFHAASGMKAYATFGDQIVLIEPIHRNGQTFYATFNKNNSDQLKKQFEIPE